MTTPNKYFIGRLDTPVRGSRFRIFRRRKNKVLITIDEMWTHKGWKKMSKGYFRQSHFVFGQAAAREEQKFWRKHGK